MKRILPTLLFIAILIAAAYSAWTHFFDHDEIEHLHAAWLALEGQRPYADFVETHPPLYWYAVSPLVNAFSVPHHAVFAARILNVALLAILVIIFMRIVKRIYPHADARWPAILLLSSFMFLHNSLEARPDPLMNLLLYAGILNWIAFLGGGRILRITAAGFLLGLSACVLQKAVVVIALMFLALGLLFFLHIRDRARRNNILKGTLLAAFAVTIPLAVLFLSMSAMGSWDDFAFWNYTYNRFFYLHAKVPVAFSVFLPLMHSFLQNPVLWIAGMAGLICWVRGRWCERNISNKTRFETRSPSPLPSPPRGEGGVNGGTVLAVVAVGYTIFLALTDMPLAQYFIVLLPLLAIFSTEIFQRFNQRWPHVALKIATTLMVALLLILFAVFETNHDQREFHRYILGHTGPTDVIAIPPPHNPIYRRDAGYFWMNGQLIGDVYSKYCSLNECKDDKIELERNLWMKRPPTYVFLNPREPMAAPLLWQEYKAQYRETALPGLFVQKVRGQLSP